MKAEALYQVITDKLIAALEAGVGKFNRPWHLVADATTPRSIAGRTYRGVNMLWLAMIAEDNGWQSGRWGTYKAWQAVDCQVRKGSKGTPVFLWKPTERTNPETGKTERGLIAMTYTVFAAEQCDGALAEGLCQPAPPLPQRERDEQWIQFWSSVGAVVIQGGNRAYYSTATDEIRVPHPDQFDDDDAYNATLAHEHVHWTGIRVGRDLRGRFGSEAYAVEELVAELGAAFLCGRMRSSVEPRQDHGEYLASWLQVLRNDPRAIVSAASKAQQAVDYLWSLGGEAVDDMPIALALEEG